LNTDSQEGRNLISKVGHYFFGGIRKIDSVDIHTKAEFAYVEDPPIRREHSAEELRKKTLLTRIISDATIITITGCKVRYVSK